MRARLRQRIARFYPWALSIGVGAVIACCVYLLWTLRVTDSITASVKTPSLLFTIGDSRSGFSGLFTGTPVDLTILTESDLAEEGASRMSGPKPGGQRFRNATISRMDVSDGVMVALDVAGGAVEMKLEPPKGSKLEPLRFRAPACPNFREPCKAEEHIFTVTPRGRHSLEFAMRFHQQPAPEPHVPLRMGSLIAFQRDGPAWIFLRDAVLSVNRKTVTDVRALRLSRLAEGSMQMSLRFSDHADKRPGGDLTADYLEADVVAETNRVFISSVEGGHERNVARRYFEIVGFWGRIGLAALGSILSLVTGIAAFPKLLESIRGNRALPAQGSSNET